MKTLFSLLTLLAFGMASAQKSDTDAINKTLDNWHADAGGAKFDAYFSAMTPDAIFIGTDATENWNIEQFKAFAKPYFDKGKAWNFKSVERHVYFNKAKDIAWFDELLDTQMKICRGSGVMRKENGQWKIAHYVLSMTFPNDLVDDVVKLKAPIEDAQLKKLQAK